MRVEDRGANVAGALELLEALVGQRPAVGTAAVGMRAALDLPSASRRRER